MPSFQWARLQAAVQTPLRRGAWYRILKLTASEAVVDVKGTPVTLARGELQLASEPAGRWSVVPAPHGAPRFPTSWGSLYAVCPNCRDRAKLEGRPAAMRCRRCNGYFEVGWTDSTGR